MSINISVSTYMMNCQDNMLKLTLGSKIQWTYNLFVRFSISEGAEEKVQATAIFFWANFDAMHMLTKNVHAPVYSHSSRTLRFEKIKWNNFSQWILYFLVQWIMDSESFVIMIREWHIYLDPFIKHLSMYIVSHSLK